MLPEIAWKNIWRNKTRSLIIITAIALGILGGLVASGVSFGMGDQMIASAIETRLSHIQIHHPDFSEDKDVTLTIPRAQSLATSIDSIRAVAGASPRVTITAMASSPTTATGVEMIGVIPSEEEKVSTIDESIVEGSYFSTDVQNPVMIGRELAKTLDVRLGSKVVFTFQNAEGELTGGAFKIKGIFRTVSSQFDKATVFIRAEDAQRLLEMDSTVFQEIAVLLTTNTALDPTVAKIQNLAPAMSVDTWKKRAPELQYVSETIAASLYIFMVVILLALAFGIVNTMLMVVLERQKELGMLMAVGMARRTIFSMIVLETVVLSLTGAVVGMVLSIITINVLQQTGIKLSFFAQGLSEFGIAEILYPQLPWTMYPILTVMMTVAAILSAVYPAIKALRLRPAEALRTS